MAHVRRQIREAAAVLVTGLGTTAGRVYQGRVYPLKAEDLPCLLVNTDDEDITSESIGTLDLERTMNLTIRGVALATADLDDMLDGILEQVETVLNGTTFGGKAKQTVIQSVRVQMTDEIDKPAGVIEMVFRVLYFTSGSAPGTAI